MSQEKNKLQVPNSPEIERNYAGVSAAIQSRQTWKVLGNPSSPPLFDPEMMTNLDTEVFEAVRLAGLAPFHYDRKQDGVPEPWRFHILRQPTCRSIASQIGSWFNDVKPNNKIPAMLSACGSLVLVNWIPQFPTAGEASDSKFDSKFDSKQLQVNEEHLAATSAAVQNLLLLLTAKNLGTYWSSGGLFRDPLMFEKIGIDSSERLLAAVFVDYQPSRIDVERIPGKLREFRSDADNWMSEIVLTREPN
jgi:nitroreductase